MKKSEKFFTVDNLKEKLKTAKALILTDYSGLKVEQINQLRQDVKKSGGEFEVVKNTLLGKASENSEFKIEKGKLEGNTAALWLYSDDLSPLKALDTFIKKNELPKLKFGFWNKDLIETEKIKELANLPSLKELQAKLVGLLKSPLSALAYNLKVDLFKLVYLLKAKGGEN
jgi:large subunit ribosomal protein L10